MECFVSVQGCFRQFWTFVFSERAIVRDVKEELWYIELDFETKQESTAESIGKETTFQTSRWQHNHCRS